MTRATVTTTMPFGDPTAFADEAPEPKAEPQKASLPPVGFMGDRIKIGRWNGTVEQARKFAERIAQVCDIAEGK